VCKAEWFIQEIMANIKALPLVRDQAPRDQAAGQHFEECLEKVEAYYVVQKGGKHKKNGKCRRSFEKTAAEMKSIGSTYESAAEIVERLHQRRKLLALSLIYAVVAVSSSTALKNAVKQITRDMNQKNALLGVVKAFISALFFLPHLLCVWLVFSSSSTTAVQFFVAVSIAAVHF
jgi:hypothetical protein